MAREYLSNPTFHFEYRHSPQHSSCSHRPRTMLSLLIQKSRNVSPPSRPNPCPSGNLLCANRVLSAMRCDHLFPQSNETSYYWVLTWLKPDGLESDRIICRNNVDASSAGIPTSTILDGQWGCEYRIVDSFPVDEIITNYGRGSNYRLHGRREIFLYRGRCGCISQIDNLGKGSKSPERHTFGLAITIGEFGVRFNPLQFFCHRFP